MDSLSNFFYIINRYNDPSEGMTLKEILCDRTIYIILMMLMNFGHAPHGVGAFYKV